MVLTMHVQSNNNAYIRAIPSLDFLSQHKNLSELFSAMRRGPMLLTELLTAPHKPADKSFADLVQLMSDHITPRPSVIVCCFNFHSRSQQSEELITDFVAELHCLSEHCKFDTTPAGWIAA